MADAYRRHGLIGAPVEEVWAIVSDPKTHPDSRFALTPAQDETLVEIEAGIDPTNLRWRLAKSVLRSWRETLSCPGSVLQDNTQAGQCAPRTPCASVSRVSGELGVSPV